MLSLSSFNPSRLAPSETPFSFFSSTPRKAFLFCLFAPTGNRLHAPQATHVTIATSAHGLRPFLLRFSVDRIQVSPSIKGELQILQKECLRSRERRICPFWATDRRCAVSCRGRPEAGGLKVAVLGCPGAGLLFASEVAAFVAIVPGGLDFVCSPVVLLTHASVDVACWGDVSGLARDWVVK